MNVFRFKTAEFGVLGAETGAFRCHLWKMTPFGSLRGKSEGLNKNVLPLKCFEKQLIPNDFSQGQKEKTLQATKSGWLYINNESFVSYFMTMHCHYRV